jgi:hypothetical protein
MPIIYNKELESWEAKDLTDDEKQSLFEIAMSEITNSFGHEVGRRIMSQFSTMEAPLEDIPKENMGNA